MTTFGILPLMPAYGRDYKSLSALKADYDAGKDFLTPGGQYANKADLANIPTLPAKIQVRYGKMRKTGMIDK